MILLCFFLQFWFSDHGSKVPAGSAYTNWVPLDKKIFWNIKLGLSSQKICEAPISASRFYISWHRHSFCGSKLISFPIWCLAIWRFSDEELIIYPIRKKRSFWTPWICWPQFLDQNNQCIFQFNFLTVRMGSVFSLIT